MSDSLHPLSARLAYLKQQAVDGASPTLATQRYTVYARVLSETAGQPQVLRVARCLAAFLHEKEVVVDARDLLAGHQQPYDYTWPEPEAATVHRDDPEGWADFQAGRRMGLYSGGLGGHVIAGYDRVLHQGWGAMASAARGKLTAEGGPEQAFAQASAIVCGAATDYALRYAQAARRLAQTVTDVDHVVTLQRIADACTWIATEPPRTFFEALQLLWLTHEVITCEQSSGSLSLGRLDQILYPYYARDLAEGTLNREEAAELTQALWCKFAGYRRGFQNVTLGGVDAQGCDAANEVSFLCIEATRALKMDQPLLSVRWHPGMSDRFWQAVEGLIGEGLGFPALFNDQIAIEAKRRAGVALEHAWNYGIVGCVEVSAPGIEFSHTEGLRVNWAKALELVLNDGVCPVTGESVPLSEEHALDEVADFDAFYSWYRRQLGHYVDLGARGLNELDVRWSMRWPYPFLSSTMAACLENGRDVTEGSTIYNLSTINGLGMANVADSLAAIKQVVFEQGKVTLAGLAEALRHDFYDAEPLRQALLASPKFGTDHDGPDLLLRQLADDFNTQIAGYRNPRGGGFQAGLYTVDSHASLADRTGSLPDGRLRGKALANSLSPSQGSDALGPTAAIKSLTKIDHRQMGNGMVLDLKFQPRFFADLVERGVFRPFVETYYRLGGMEIQFSVVDRETLLAAQLQPREHAGLVVRVSGFSAYFVTLDRVLQDEIIARTEHVGI